MKYTVAVLIGMAVLFSACGRDPQESPIREPGFCTTTAVPGGAQIWCSNGTSTVIYNGAQGSQGNSGANGQDGAQGPQGIPGAPGTVVEAVQFCPGYTTSYPSRFAEVGFCVEGQLYGVYWDGRNAWWTLIPPGYYASTSTSAPCNFYVAAGCQVHQ